MWRYTSCYLTQVVADKHIHQILCKLHTIWFQMHAILKFFIYRKLKSTTVYNSGRHSKLARTFDAPLGFTVQS